ncbi:MAG: hypothetical protein ACRC67_03100 [Inquilinus sp.]|uniref:hypothetical protein n=1 Tax=Inquilinus sp. TaxID=1932117 RepID=UPI003F41AE1F
MKDAKAGREEATGIAHLIAGVAMGSKDDEQSHRPGLPRLRQPRPVFPQEARISGRPRAWPEWKASARRQFRDPKLPRMESRSAKPSGSGRAWPP